MRAVDIQRELHTQAYVTFIKIRGAFTSRVEIEIIY